MNDKKNELNLVKNLLEKHMPKGFKCSIIEPVVTVDVCEHPNCYKTALWKTEFGIFCTEHMKEITKTGMEHKTEWVN